MELGGDFNLRIEELKVREDSLYSWLAPYSFLLLDSGRSAIKLIAGNMDKGTALLPEYICDSVINAFKGFEIVFYGLKGNLEIDLDDVMAKINNKTKVVVIMHYFGALQPQAVLRAIKNKKDVYDFFILEDTTHSLLTKACTIGDYCVGSLRKWMPIPDGGVLYSKKNLEFEGNFEINSKIEKAYGMILKTLFLDTVGDFNYLYREIFKEAEEYFDKKNKIEKISGFSEYILGCFNIRAITDKRKENYNYLAGKLISLGIRPVVSLDRESCPFVMPVLSDDRDSLRSYLKGKNIYCAVHWPLDKSPLKDNQRSVDLSSKIISLPVDQRYGLMEMDYMADVIAKYEGAF